MSALADSPPTRGGPLEERFPFARCRCGVARRDITPPVGVRHRLWGAATHSVAEAVHRPLLATAIVISPLSDEDTEELALVSLDFSWLGNASDQRHLRERLQSRTGLRGEQLLVHFSHTHAGVDFDSASRGEPGFQETRAYFLALVEEVADLVCEARARRTAAWLTYGYGTCELAHNRDLLDPATGVFVCGYNPSGGGDRTLLVARVTDDTGRTMAVVFNYACHPTSLGWDNRALSPDYVGAAREIVERAFEAPAVFLQGAAGDLAPRDQYSGDVQTADKNGRQLGYAVAAAVEALPPPGMRLVYTGVVGSGANLGTWGYAPISSDQEVEASVVRACLVEVDLPLKDDLGELTAPIGSELSASAIETRARRRALLRAALEPEAGRHRMPLWVWRLGQGGLLALPQEPYSHLQVEVRRRFQGLPVFVLMTTNGGLGYLPPRGTYGTGRYQEEQAPFAAGSLEIVIDEASSALERLFS